MGGDPLCDCQEICKLQTYAFAEGHLNREPATGYRTMLMYGNCIFAVIYLTFDVSNPEIAGVALSRPTNSAGALYSPQTDEASQCLCPSRQPPQQPKHWLSSV